MISKPRTLIAANLNGVTVIVVYWSESELILLPVPISWDLKALRMVAPTISSVSLFQEARLVRNICLGLLLSLSFFSLIWWPLVRESFGCSWSTYLSCACTVRSCRHRTCSCRISSLRTCSVACLHWETLGWVTVVRLYILEQCPIFLVNRMSCWVVILQMWPNKWCKQPSKWLFPEVSVWSPD